MKDITASIVLPKDTRLCVQGENDKLIGGDCLLVAGLVKVEERHNKHLTLIYRGGHTKTLFNNSSKLVKKLKTRLEKYL